MKTSYYVLSLFITIFISCKKDNVAEIVTVATENKATVGEQKWVGAYNSSKVGAIFFDDTSFIKNGYAHIKNLNKRAEYFFSWFTLSVPVEKIPNADSITLVARIRNDSGTVNSYYPYSTTFYLFSENAEVTACYSASAQFARINRTYLPSLVKVFDGWTILVLKLSRHHIMFSERPLDEANKIKHYQSLGNLKAIRIDFDGCGFIDWVKLYTGFPDRLIMEENFDGPGSHVIWYE